MSNDVNVEKASTIRPQKKESIVIVDIDGVLADMSKFDHILGGKNAEERKIAWREFFKHIPEAAPLDDGIDLINALANIGCTIVYSTTRPYYCGAQTRQWIKDADLPDGLILSRTRQQSNISANDIKLLHIKHTKALTNGHIILFIDDDPAAVLAIRTKIPSIAPHQLPSSMLQLRKVIDGVRERTLPKPKFRKTKNLKNQKFKKNNRKFRTQPKKTPNFSSSFMPKE